jgi:hypothetical protein
MNTLTATDLLSRVRAIGMADFDPISEPSQPSLSGFNNTKSPTLKSLDDWNQTSPINKGVLTSPTFSYRDEIWADNYGRTVKKT